MKLKYIKNIFIIWSFIIMSTTNVFSKLNDKNWEYVCDDKNVNCIIGIKNIVTNKDTKNSASLATVYLRIGTSSKKKLDLLDKENQTYKLGEQKTNIPILFINLPLNVDLRSNPIILVGKKSIKGLTFLHCNKDVGCKTMLMVSENVLELLKNEINISVVFRAFGSPKNLEISFPLKGFTKSYSKLIQP